MNTPRIPRPEDIEVIDDATAAMFRAMTIQQKTAFGEGIRRGVIEVLRSYLRYDYPNWDELRVQEEIARILLISADSDFIPPITVSEI